MLRSSWNILSFMAMLIHHSHCKWDMLLLLILRPVQSLVNFVSTVYIALVGVPCLYTRLCSLIPAGPLLCVSHKTLLWRSSSWLTRQLLRPHQRVREQLRQRRQHEHRQTSVSATSDTHQVSVTCLIKKWTRLGKAALSGLRAHATRHHASPPIQSFTVGGNDWCFFYSPSSGTVWDVCDVLLLGPKSLFLPRDWFTYCSSKWKGIFFSLLEGRGETGYHEQYEHQQHYTLKINWFSKKEDIN